MLFLCIYIAYALYKTFFSTPEIKDIKAYELICDTKEIPDNKDIEVVIKKNKDGRAIIMKASVNFDDSEEGRLIIDNSSYKLEPLDNKKLKFHVFDEVSTREIEEAKK